MSFPELCKNDYWQ